MVLEITCAYYNTVLVHKSRFLEHNMLWFRFRTKNTFTEIKRCSLPLSTYFVTLFCIVFRTFQDHYPYDCAGLRELNTFLRGTTRNISREPTTFLFFSSCYIFYNTSCTYFDILLPTFIDILFSSWRKSKITVHVREGKRAFVRSKVL